jgi:hypothetical protein
MKNKILFVGEKKSNLARKKKWSWEDGRLAAKQLFDALDECSIDPSNCLFENWFNTQKQPFIKAHNGPVVGMGKVVQKALDKAGVNHIPLVHPAARGKIRKKELYIEHVRETFKKYEVIK